MRASEFLADLYQHCGGGMILVRHLPSARTTYIPTPRDVDPLISKEENVYFGVGLRAERSGKAASVSEIPAVWVDVDDKATGSHEASRERLGRSPVGWTAIIDTGGGYHAYLRLKEAARREDHSTVVEVNRALARICNSDPNVADTARIMRLPGGVNHKYTPPPKVSLVEHHDNEADLSELSEFLVGPADAAERRTFKSLEIRNEELQRVMQCRFMRHCEENAEALPEPLWYAMISNLAGFRGSPGLIHRLSRPHKGYDASVTDKKILHALDASGPISCAKIRQDGFDCPKSCGVRSPAGLAWKTIQIIDGGENPFAARDAAMKELVESAIPPTGWIREYVDFSSTLTDAPKVFHLAAAYGVLGSVLGRKCCTPNFGSRDLYPNIWTVLVAPSSTYRKSTVLGIANDFLSSAQVPILPQEFTPESMVQTLAASPQATFLWEELGGALARLNRDYMGGTKDVLAQLYDCPEEYKRNLTKTRFDVKNPFISVISATNVDWMTRAANVAADMRGGFLARWSFVPYLSKDFEMPTPPGMDRTRRQALLEELVGFWEYKPARFQHSHLGELRARTKQIREDAMNQNIGFGEELGGVFSRIEATELKVAMLDAVSTGHWGGEIPEDAMIRALRWCRFLATSAVDMLTGIAANPDDAKVREVLGKIKALHARGDEWVSMEDLMSVCRRSKEFVRQGIRTLLDTKQIREKQGGTYVQVILRG